MQAPVAAVFVRLEQAGADRLLENWIVEKHGDERSRALAGMFPACADLRPVLIAEMNAIGDSAPLLDFARFR